MTLPRHKRYTQEELAILDNSIERVIKTTQEILLFLNPKGEVAREKLDINIEDWRALKEVVVNLWNTERNAIFQRHQDD